MAKSFQSRSDQGVVLFLLATLLLIALAFGALALIFVPVFRAREFDKKHVPSRNWILAGVLIALAICLGLFGLPALSV